MGETYFDYILSKCRKRTIGKVCKRYQIPSHLQRSLFNNDDVKKVIFSGYSNEPLVDIYYKMMREELNNG